MVAAAPLVIGPGIGTVGLSALPAGGFLAAGGGLSAAGALGGFATGLNLAGSALGFIGATRAINDRNDARDDAADLAESRATQELLRGKQEGNTVRRARIRAVASAAAQQAAGGIDLSSGPFQAVFREIDVDANRQLEIVRSNAQIGALSERTQARNLRRRKQSSTVPALAAALPGLTNAISLQTDIQ